MARKPQARYYASRKGGGYFATFNGKLHELARSEEHTSELQSRGHLVCRLLLEKKNTAGSWMLAATTGNSVSRLLCLDRVSGSSGSTSRTPPSARPPPAGSLHCAHGSRQHCRPD